MKHWLDNTLHHLQLGETLIAEGVEALFDGWRKTSADVIGKLCTGAERWQAAIRKVQATADAAHPHEAPEDRKPAF